MSIGVPPSLWVSSNPSCVFKICMSHQSPRNMHSPLSGIFFPYLQTTVASQWWAWLNVNYEKHHLTTWLFNWRHSHFNYFCNPKKLSIDSHILCTEFHCQAGTLICVTPVVNTGNVSHKPFHCWLNTEILLAWHKYCVSSVSECQWTMELIQCIFSVQIVKY